MHSCIQALGVPVVGMGTGNVGRRVHAPDENTRVVNFENGVKFAAAFFACLAGM